jgi:hypothetical protein
MSVKRNEMVYREIIMKKLVGIRFYTLNKTHITTTKQIVPVVSHITLTLECKALDSSIVI